MLYKISDLSFDISEDYRSEIDNKADFNTIIKTIDNYDAGNWESTCWMLGVVYGEYFKNNLIHSFGVAVSRQNSETIIETASKELKKTINDIVKQLNSNQTDERYLQNLVKFMPKKISELKLMSIELVEQLVGTY